MTAPLPPPKPSAPIDHTVPGLAQGVADDGFIDQVLEQYKRNQERIQTDAMSEQTAAVNAIVTGEGDSRLVEACIQAMGAFVPKDMDLPLRAFCRQRLWIRPKEGGMVSFNVNALQKKYLARKRLAIAKGAKPRFLVLKSRRVGITTIEAAADYQLCATTRNVAATMLAHRNEDSAKIWRIVDMFRKHDPRKPYTKERGLSIEIPGLNSRLDIGTAGSRGYGRGDTLQRVHWAEVAWSCLGGDQVAKQSELLVGLEEAATHGEVVLETTPRQSELFKAKYEEAKAGKNSWTPMFFAWYDDPGNRVKLTPDQAIDIVGTLTDEEKDLVGKFGLAPEQIAWRRAKIADITLRLFRQEYPEDDASCFLLSGQCFFDVEQVLSIINRLKAQAPLYENHIPGGFETVWEEPVEGAEYCLGADTSEGLAGDEHDDAAICVVRYDTGKQVARIYGRFQPNVQADHIVRLGRKYNRAYLCIERNNTSGGAVCSKVMDARYGEDQMFMLSEVRPGFSTDGSTRQVVLNDILTFIQTYPGRVNDPLFCRQCLSFVLQKEEGKEGKFAAGGTDKDDCVMGWALAEHSRRFKPAVPTLTII